MYNRRHFSRSFSVPSSYVSSLRSGLRRQRLQPEKFSSCPKNFQISKLFFPQITFSSEIHQNNTFYRRKKRPRLRNTHDCAPLTLLTFFLLFLTTKRQNNNKINCSIWAQLLFPNRRSQLSARLSTSHFRLLASPRSGVARKNPKSIVCASLLVEIRVLNGCVNE